MQDARATHLHQAVVLLAVVTAAALTLPFLPTRSLGTDEINSLYMAGHFDAALADSNMLLYYGGLRIWSVIGTGEFALLTIPVVFSVARRLHGAPAAAFAAVLLATNVFFLRYAQEVRSYSLFLLLASFSVLLLLRALDSPTPRKWCALGVVTAAAVYAHFFAILLIPVHALITMLSPSTAARGRSIAIGVAVTAALVAPIAFLTPLGAEQIAWIQPPSPTELIGVPRRLAGGRVLLVLMASLAAWGGFCAARHERTAMRGVLACAAWFAVPILVAFAFSRLFNPVFSDRYLILSLPAMVILAAAGVARLPGAPLRGVALLALVAGSAWSIDDAYPEPEDWRGATSLLLAEAQQGDAVVFAAGRGVRQLDYHMQRHDPERGDGPGIIASGPLPSAPRVWFVVPEVGVHAPPNAAATAAMRERLAATRARSAIHRVAGVTLEVYGALDER